MAPYHREVGTSGFVTTGPTVGELDYPQRVLTFPHVRRMPCLFFREREMFLLHFQSKYNTNSL